MKFYRVHKSNTDDGSCGYAFCTTKREAKAIAHTWMRQSSDEGGVYDARIDLVVVVPAKQSILAVLNRFASHPDNG